ncbi:MAG TPA: type VII secretion protein EccCa, partial [Intrasporangium sp.]|nr:type VII secretion protein EccCa [Intrasporangium sp.]
MSTTLRHARLDEPELPTGQIVLKAPPQLRERDGTGGILNALPMLLGSLGSIVLVATMGSRTGGRSYIAAGMFLFATLGFILVQLDRQRKQRAQQLTASRAEYLRYLGNVRETAREAADQQRRALAWHHPEPSALPSLAEERSRMWEHDSSDANFLHVRYGVCAQPLSLELVLPESAPIDQVDPAAASALHRLLVVHRVQPNLPAGIDLRAFDRIELCGPEEPARALARAMLCSAAAFHAPEHLVIAVLSTERTLAHWDWLKWLPHAQSAQQSDAIGPSRMVTTSPADLAALLPPNLCDRPPFGAEERPALPHILLVTDGARLPCGNHVVPPDGLYGVTVLDLPTRWDELEDPTRLRLEFNTITDGSCPEGGKAPVTALRLREDPIPALADQCDLATAEAFARRIAPLHNVPAAPTKASGEITGPTDFMELLGLGDVHSFEPSVAWRHRPARDRLRVPIGLGEDGAVVHLDLKESAQQGMGPHGLVIGATGSGKSELLRTLVLGLAMTHSPEHLNLVLVDFKGGATFAGMSGMPHVSAMITNLAQELTLVDRMQDALSGEMIRRQELLREAGNFASVRDYEKARAVGEDLEPLPSLFIVVDEFSEMLAAKPEFIDLFGAIGRLGRSLGLHLLLASQRLEEGRLRGLESHLSYRIGLRTFSAGESRSVLGVPDAYELPPIPGLGYLKPDQSS